MSKLEAIYRRMPVSLQNVACNWQGRRIHRRRYSPDFFELLSGYESRSRWSADKLCAFRDQRLRTFVANSVRHAPYYRQLFAEAGVEPDAIQTLSDLSVLPILSRQQAQELGSALYTGHVSDEETIAAHTSGTTGTGLRFRQTISAEQEQWAVWWRYRRIHGIGFDTRCAVFGGRPIVPVEWKNPPFWRYNRTANQIFFSGYHLKEENLPSYVAELRESGAEWLHGYPSHLTLLADYITSEGVNLRDQVRYVTIGAESLLEHQRQAINKAFDVTVRQHYGLAEGVANISECSHGRLHVDEDFSPVEFVRRAESDICSVIGSNVTNPAFPLLRYDTGDTVELEDSLVCPCGFGGRIVKSIDGRIEDYILLADGSRIGRMDHIFKDLTTIREAQIVQRTSGVIKVRIVKSAGFSEVDERRLLAEIHAYCGSGLDVEINYVESIPRSKTGKLRFVVSELKRSSIQGP